MSAIRTVPTGLISQEQLFIWAAMSLQDAFRTLTVTTAQGVSEPVVSVSEVRYPTIATNPNRLVVVAYVPVVDDRFRTSGKDWVVKPAQFGSTAIDASFNSIT